jgi:hypothetical protein
MTSEATPGQRGSRLLHAALEHPLNVRTLRLPSPPVEEKIAR